MNKDSKLAAAPSASHKTSNAFGFVPSLGAAKLSDNDIW